MQSALLARRLDPHRCLLHVLGRNHPALASDLIEPYRVLIADSFVLTLVNNARVAVRDFERRGPGVFLTGEGRRKVLGEYERFTERPAGGPRASGPARVLVDASARAMLDVVLGRWERLVLPLSAGEGTRPGRRRRGPMTGALLTVLVYDVACDRRRGRILRLLRQYGTPVQASAFEARLAAAERRALLRRVEGMIDPRKDSLIAYVVTQDQQERIAPLGRP